MIVCMCACAHVRRCESMRSFHSCRKESDYIANMTKICIYYEKMTQRERKEML